MYLIEFNKMTWWIVLLIVVFLTPIIILVGLWVLHGGLFCQSVVIKNGTAMLITSIHHAMFLTVPDFSEEVEFGLFAFIHSFIPRREFIHIHTYEVTSDIIDH